MFPCVVFFSVGAQPLRLLVRLLAETTRERTRLAVRQHVARELVLVVAAVAASFASASEEFPDAESERFWVFAPQVASPAVQADVGVGFAPVRASDVWFAVDVKVRVLSRASHRVGGALRRGGLAGMPFGHAFAALHAEHDRLEVARVARGSAHAAFVRDRVAGVADGFVYHFAVVAEVDVAPLAALFARVEARDDGAFDVEDALRGGVARHVREEGVVVHEVGRVVEEVGVGVQRVGGPNVLGVVLVVLAAAGVDAADAARVDATLAHGRPRVGADALQVPRKVFDDTFGAPAGTAERLDEGGEVRGHVCGGVWCGVVVWWCGFLVRHVDL